MSMSDPRTVGTQPPERVNLLGAVKSFYTRFARFSGRASRSEYWWMALAYLLVSTAFGLLMGAFDGGVVGGIDDQDPARLSPAGNVVLVIAQIVALVHVIPGLSLTVRRLHDSDHSGWWSLLYLTPLVALALGVTMGMLFAGGVSAGPSLIVGILAVMIVLAGPICLFILTLMPSNARGARFDRAPRAVPEPVRS